MPCYFRDGLSFDDFSAIANKVAKKMKRVKSISVNGPIIYCNVESQTGYSDWNFSVDFNDWGHITGTYWTNTDNDDSSIPSHYGQIVSGEIHDSLADMGVTLKGLSDYVDENKELETSGGLNYYFKPELFTLT